MSPGIECIDTLLTGCILSASSILILCAAWALSPKVRAGCGKSARPDPRRGSWVTVIPTPTLPSLWSSRSHSLLGSKEPTLLCNHLTYRYCPGPVGGFLDPEKLRPPSLDGHFPCKCGSESPRRISPRTQCRRSRCPRGRILQTERSPRPRADRGRQVAQAPRSAELISPIKQRPSSLAP
jgi:hypothetical protein